MIVVMPVIVVIVVVVVMLVLAEMDVMMEERRVPVSQVGMAEGKALQSRGGQGDEAEEGSEAGLDGTAPKARSQVGLHGVRCREEVPAARVRASSGAPRRGP